VSTTGGFGADWRDAQSRRSGAMVKVAAVTLRDCRDGFTVW
jgi:hypothetical protein